jgi:CRISPR-associated protein Cas2
MFILVAYDIENDKLRAKVAAAMESYGKRVQYSVFECNLTQPQYAALKKRLAGLMEKAGDEEAWSIRFYRLCEACVKRIEILGQGDVTRDEAFYIV